ncbi:MAG: DciA family protein [Paracoccaceae bacterium]
MASQTDQPRRKRKGFVQTGGLLAAQIRTIGGARGFAQTRLLTQWAEIAGPELAAITRPGKVSYGRQGVGAVLALECDGAHAPEVQMQLPALLARINAAYGYAAIRDIRITQVQLRGFAEGQAAFEHATKPAPKLGDAAPAPVADAVAGVADEGLRAQLALLGANVLNKKGPNT